MSLIVFITKLLSWTPMTIFLDWSKQIFVIEWWLCWCMNILTLKNARSILTKFNCADELWIPFQLINYFCGKSSRHLHMDDWRSYKSIIVKPTEQTVDCIDVSEELLAPGRIPEFHNVPLNSRWTGCGEIFFLWYNNFWFGIKPNFYTICHNRLLVIIL